ncbi:MAG: phosphate ABC transporter permease PstA [Rectinemataceae bacterium]
MRDKKTGSHRARIRGQRFAFGTIRAFSFLTIVILGFILGFILVRGLRFSNDTRSTVLPYTEAAPDGLCLVVNQETDLKTLDFPMLYGMFTDEYINWSKISQDDFDLMPIVVDDHGKVGAASGTFIFGSGQSPLWGRLVKKVPDAPTALATVDSTPGSATIVPLSALSAGRASGMYKRVTSVGVRRLSLAINDDVAAIVDNKSIEDIDDAAVSRLASGSIRNWKELGGPDLAVKLLAPSAGSPLAAAVTAAGFPIKGIEAPAGEATDAHAAALSSTSGAVSFLFSAEAVAGQIQTLTRVGHENGWNLTFKYLVTEPRLSGKVGGISTIILNTFFMLILTVLMAAPIGVAAAVYLVEYAKQGLLVKILRLGTETLAGIPSIIFGLFGFLFFVTILHFGFGLLSGCLTLMLMILPTIVRTSEEALKSVPGALREGSLALGATKLQTVFRVVVPAAMPGILTGLILGVGRAVGETAALLFTMGSDYKLARGLFSSARALSAHIYLLFAEGISFDRAFSTATVLIVIVLIFNFGARRLIGRMGSRA